MSPPESGPSTVPRSETSDQLSPASLQSNHSAASGSNSSTGFKRQLSLVRPEVQRIAQACDQCNYRKIKCRSSSSPSQSSTEGRCIGCERANIACTWQRTAQRRGPKRKKEHPTIQPQSPRSALTPGDHPSITNGRTTDHHVEAPDQGEGSAGTIPWGLTSFPVGETSVTPTRLPPASSDMPHEAIRTQHDVYPEGEWSWISNGLTPSGGSGSFSGEPSLPAVSYHSTSSEESNAWPFFFPELPFGANHLNATQPSSGFIGFDSSDQITTNAFKPVHINWHSLESSPTGLAQHQQLLSDPPSSSYYDAIVQLARGRAELPAESIVNEAIKHPTEPLLMLAIPPFPESHAIIRKRISIFFVLLAPFVPLLHYEEFMTAFDNREYERSIHFRALLLSMLSMYVVSNVDAKTMLPGNKTPPTSEEVEVMSDQIKEAYLRDAQRANALSDSDGTICLADIVTALHLFLASEWQKAHHRSWDYLQQAITRAQASKVDHLAQIVSDERPDGEGHSPGLGWWATRLRTYYILTLLERTHALLRPLSMVHAQSLRLPGRPWQETRRLREALPSFAMNGLQTGHVRSLDLVDDRIIRCWREKKSCSDWTSEEAVSIQNELGEHMESIVTGKFGSTKDAWEMGRLINNAVTVAWLRDLVFQICLTHGLIDPASPEPALRPTLVLNNLRLAILSPRCKTYIQQVASSDFSSDTFGKLYDITMTAIRTAEVLKAQRLGQGSGLLHENIPSTASSSGGGHRSSDGLSQPRGPGDHDIIWDFADVILKSMGILCMAARDHPALVRLVHAVARII